MRGESETGKRKDGAVKQPAKERAAREFRQKSQRYYICLPCRGPGFNSWVWKIPWRRDRLPTPVFLTGESPWTEEPGGLQSVGSQRVRLD